MGDIMEPNIIPNIIYVYSNYGYIFNIDDKQITINFLGMQQIDDKITVTLQVGFYNEEYKCFEWRQFDVDITHIIKRLLVIGNGVSSEEDR